MNLTPILSDKASVVAKRESKKKLDFPKIN